MDIHTYLKEWAVQYFKNRDIVAQKITAIEQKKDAVLIKYNDHEELILPYGNLEEFKEQPSEKCINIVAFNVHKNFKVLLAKWDLLVKFPNLKIFFINPFSEADHKWIIAPAVHHRISDGASLKRGLQAMFETVPTITEEELEENIKTIQSL